MFNRSYFSHFYMIKSGAKPFQTPEVRETTMVGRKPILTSYNEEELAG